jgi:hypothetical protein
MVGGRGCHDLGGSKIKHFLKIMQQILGGIQMPDKRGAGCGGGGDKFGSKQPSRLL